MRAFLSVLAVVAACHPSATVENTMPVANLQAYRTVALRVHSTAFASQGKAMMLERSVLEKLRQRCGFEQVAPSGGASADVVLDLNITNTGRGGGGWITNENISTIDTLLVLTDGQDGELLGTARIVGKSSGVIVNNASGDGEAVDVVAKSVADLLAKSGCSGPRIARVSGPAPAVGPDNAPPDATKLAAAEALNEEGKVKLYGADIAGALAAFQGANALVPDPRFVFNVCIALGAQEQWDQAIAACRQARGMNPQPNLAAKIDTRIDLLQHRK